MAPDPKTPRRGLRRAGARRAHTLKKLAPIGLGVAAVVAVLLIGSNLLGSSSPPPNTASTDSADIADSSSSAAASLPDGPHVVHANSDGYFGVTVTIAAPLWRGQPDEGRLIWNDDIDPPAGAGMIIWAGPNDEFYVYGDPCHWSSTKPDTTVATVDEFVAALASQALRVPSAPEDITVDGYAGKKIILGMAADVDFDACDGGDFVLFGQAGDDMARYSQGPGQIEEMWVLDVDGRIVIQSGFYYPDTPQNAVDELQAIFASATFELP
jgi:hypothetical protein